MNSNNFVEHKFGLVLKTDRHLVAFCNGSVDFDQLAELWPNLSFVKLRQIHSAKCLEIGSLKQTLPPPSADAQFTQVTGLGLAVQTADCMPILFVSPYQVATIHAGWRGLVMNVIGNTLKTFANRKELAAYFGPHILSRSFEVGADVAEQILSFGNRYQNENNKHLLDRCCLEHADPSKRYIDLQAIALAQLIDFGLRPNQVQLATCDTLTSLNWESYRRDRSKAKRNLSFCALL